MRGKALGLSCARTSSAGLGAPGPHLLRFCHFPGNLAGPSLLRWPGRFLVAPPRPAQAEPMSVGSRVSRIFLAQTLRCGDSAAASRVISDSPDPCYALRRSARGQSPPPWQIVLGRVRVFLENRSGEAREVAVRGRGTDKERKLGAEIFAVVCPLR